MCVGMACKEAVPIAGPCLEELDQWCAAVKPGEGRLAKCITDQLADESKPGYAGTKTSEPCKKALTSFKIERSDNINRDLPLAKACKTDADKLCAGNFEVGQQIHSAYFFTTHSSFSTAHCT